MYRRAFIYVALVGSFLGQAACGGSMGKAPSLLTEARGYNDGIRWAQPEKSALRVPADLRSDFVAEREQFLDDLRVGDYEIKSIRYREARTAARIDVRYTWHLDSRGVVHKTTSRQSWERRGKLWLMVAEQRVRGEPMPGLPEPDDEQDDMPDDTEAEADGDDDSDSDVVGVRDASSERSTGANRGGASDRSKKPKRRVVFDSGPVPR